MHLTRRDALLAAAAVAGLPAAAAQAGGFHRMRVGNTEVVVATDGLVARASLPAGFIPNATPEEVNAALAAAGHTQGVPPNTYNPVAVRTRDGLVLLDIGFGPNGPGGTGQLLANWRAAGIEPNEAIAIAFTHFHGDHINGLVGADGVPLFPRARILVPEAEWAFWTDSGEASRAPEGRRPAFANAASRFAPYAQRVERFAPGAEIAPGIRSVASVGHSPGHSSFLIHDGSAQLFVVGDAVNLPALFMARPDWYPAFDMDPPTAVATRRAMLDRLATDRIPCVGYHFPLPAVGLVERAGNGFRLAQG